MTSHPSWSLIVGRGEDDKRSWIRLIIARLREKGLSVGGALSIPLPNHQGYDLENLATGEHISLARTSGRPDICDLAFDHSAFETTRSWCLDAPWDVVFLEAHKLERAGRGHRATIEALLDTGHAHVLLAIRPNPFMVSLLMEWCEPVADLRLPLTDAQPAEDFVKRLLSARRRRTTPFLHTGWAAASAALPVGEHTS